MIHFYRVVGNYNLLNPSEKSAQYVVTGISKDIVKEYNLTMSFIIDLECDPEVDPEEETVFDMLDALERAYENNYVIHSGIKNIRKLRDYLENNGITWEQLRIEQLKNKIEWTERQIEVWKNELDELLG